MRIGWRESKARARRFASSDRTAAHVFRVSVLGKEAAWRKVMCMSCRAIRVGV